MLLPAKDVIEPGIQFNLIFVKILEKLFCAQHFGDTDQLVVVVVPVEEGLLAEDHRG